MKLAPSLLLLLLPTTTTTRGAQARPGPAAGVARPVKARAPSVIVSLIVGGDHAQVHNAAHVTTALLSTDTLIFIHVTRISNERLLGQGSLWWHTERVLAACCGPRVILNAERRPLTTFGKFLQTELLSAHLSNLALCERSAIPCANDSRGATHVMLLAPDVLLYRRGVEQYVTRYEMSVGIEAVASGSFCRLRHIRPLLGSTHSAEQVLLAWRRQLRAAKQDLNGVSKDSVPSIGKSIAHALPLEGNETPALKSRLGAHGRNSHAFAWRLPPRKLRLDVSWLVTDRSLPAPDPGRTWSTTTTYSSNCSIEDSTCAFNGRGFSDCKLLRGRWRGDPHAEACAAVVTLTANLSHSGDAAVSDSAQAAMSYALQSLPHRRQWPRRSAPFAIACLGDSHTSGVGATSRRQSYPARLQMKLSTRAPFVASGVVVANLGAPAAKVGRPLDGLLRAKESVASYWRMPHFEAATNGTAWDAIVLMFGTNDLRAEPSDRNAALSSRSASPRAAPCCP